MLTSAIFTIFIFVFLLFLLSAYHSGTHNFAPFLLFLYGKVLHHVRRCPACPHAPQRSFCLGLPDSARHLPPLSLSFLCFFTFVLSAFRGDAFDPTQLLLLVIQRSLTPPRTCILWSSLSVRYITLNLVGRREKRERMAALTTVSSVFIVMAFVSMD